MRSSIHYRDGVTNLTGVLMCDETRSDRRPGILVVHGGAGLDAHAEGRARQLAELGYVVFACDMYGDGVAGDRQRIMARIAALRADRAAQCARAWSACTAASRPSGPQRREVLRRGFSSVTARRIRTARRRMWRRSW